MSSTKILVLGSGMVARPCVEYLSRSSSNNITVACRTLSTAQELITDLPRTIAVRLDVTRDEELEEAIAACDVVISLVPYLYHAQIIRFAIKHEVNVVTTSYVSPVIKALEEDAKKAGIVIVMEVGVDPGVDHLYAIKTIDEVHDQGGKIKEFYSYCGGLPAPECANNPLGMKFSWSPRGVFMSQCNSASFLQNNKRVDIPATELMSHARPYHVVDGYSFLAYPNRDSTPFREFYNIPEAETVVRGSLRYDGNPQLTRALLKTGWLDAGAKDWLSDGHEMTWAEVSAKAMGAEDASEAALIAQLKTICNYATSNELDFLITGFRWMSLFSSSPASLQPTLLDTLAKRLEKLLSYQPDERDLVMLQHKFVIEWADGKKETRTSTLELFGEQRSGGYSAMALSVGVTCGVATQLMIDGHKAFSKPGLVAPYTREVCEPIRLGVEREGVVMVEKTL